MTVAAQKGANDALDSESVGHPGISGTRPTKRGGRRTKAEIEALETELFDVVSEYRPMTVRQVFYQMVTRGVIDKSEAEYKNTVCRLLTRMRMNRELPYDWIADNTRWMRKPQTHDNIEAALQLATESYRRNLWRDSDSYVEVWLEKEALAGVLLEETATWDVPLMVTRGYPSLSFLHSAAECIAESDKDVYLYYFGDHDPSGVDIPRFVEERIGELAPDTYINFECVAVTPRQIKRYDLPTRPTKKTDTRAKTFKGESVEVDAIDPATLRALVKAVITAHIDADEWERLQQVEAAERESAAAFIRGFVTS